MPVKRFEDAEAYDARNRICALLAVIPYPDDTA